MVKPSTMGKTKATPQIEYSNINEKLWCLKELTVNHHWSALPVNDSAIEEAVREVWNITNIWQLKYWMKQDPETVFQMLNELQTQWDLDLKTMRLYNELQKGDYKKLYIITQSEFKKAWKQVSCLTKELARFYNDLNTTWAQQKTITISLTSDMSLKIKMTELPHSSYLINDKKLTYQ